MSLKYLEILVFLSYRKNFIRIKKKKKKQGRVGIVRISHGKRAISVWVIWVLLYVLSWTLNWNFSQFIIPCQTCYHCTQVGLPIPQFRKCRQYVFSLPIRRLRVKKSKSMARHRISPCTWKFTMRSFNPHPQGYYLWQFQGSSPKSLRGVVLQ